MAKIKAVLMLSIFWMHHRVDLHLFWLLIHVCCTIFYLVLEAESFYLKMRQENIFFKKKIFKGKYF